MKGGEFWVSHSLQVSKFFLLVKFVGVEQGPPSLDQIRGMFWNHKKSKPVPTFVRNLHEQQQCRWEDLSRMSSLVRQVTQDKADDPNPTGEITKLLILGISTFDPST